MYPFYFDCGGAGGEGGISAVNPWLASAADCKPPPHPPPPTTTTVFDDRPSTSWITPSLSQATLSPTAAAAYFPPASTFYQVPQARYPVARCDVTESPLTSSPGNPLQSRHRGVQSASLMSAALLQSAADAADVSLAKNLPEHSLPEHLAANHAGVINGSTPAAEALRLHTKSHSSSGRP